MFLKYNIGLFCINYFFFVCVWLNFLLNFCIFLLVKYEEMCNNWLVFKEIVKCFEIIGKIVENVVFFFIVV